MLYQSRLLQAFVVGVVTFLVCFFGIRAELRQGRHLSATHVAAAPDEPVTLQ